MNRFEYSSPALLPNERCLANDRNVKLYDGDQKTSFEGGEIMITTYRIIWGRPGAISAGQECLSLSLSYVIFVEEENASSFSFRCRKLILHLTEPSPDRNLGPLPTSNYDFVKLSFKDGFSTDIVSILNDCIQKKKWEPTSKVLPKIKLRTGIVGIERSLQEKQKAADESISVAFKDLSKLMAMAKDMVNLSRTISKKIRDRQGDITEDETIRFKSYLMTLGIDDPVTRDSHKSENLYYRSLAKEICDILQTPISEVGGMMTLADVYCRVNRARCLELVSPEDLLNACKIMESLELPLKLYQFSSGVMVLQLQTLDDKSVAEATAELLEEKGSLSCEELAQLLGISVILAKERLRTAENLGKCCRDDSMEGLRFYPNLFLTRED